jgi:esterase
MRPSSALATMSFKLAFEIIGEGPPVVILHGLFSAGRNWARIAQNLGHAYRFYLPDARNHGASSWAETMTYPDMARDVVELINREQLMRPLIIGHNIGGKTAMALALEYPHAIGGIAVIDIAPKFYADQFSLHVTAMRGLDLTGSACCKDLRPMPRRSARDSLLGNAALIRNLRHQSARFDWRFNLMANALCMQDLCDFPGGLTHLRYMGPALFVTGADSNFVRPESHAVIKRLFQNVRWASIAGAGHWVHADQPEALEHALQKWLKETSASKTNRFASASHSDGGVHAVEVENTDTLRASV